jgi:hydroxyacylglutathione hydrolase
MLKIITIPVTPINQNARVLFCSESKNAVVIDPGGDAVAILKVVQKEQLTVNQLWLTHSHFDHCGGVAELMELLAEKSSSPVELLGHRFEKEMRSRVTEIVGAFGLAGFGFRNCPEPDKFIEDNDVVSVGSHEFAVLFAPGHSPGHVCFYSKSEKILLAGDTIFQGSIGRTDLPMGNHAQLIKSIHDKLLVLPDDTVVLSGHGEDTTIGKERRTNPYLV